MVHEGKPFYSFAILLCCRHLALTYATNHADMSLVDRPGCGDGGYNFGKQGGITNGAAWYSIEGGNFI